MRFEADDVIGTLARKAAEASHPVYVVSSDKDMMQLVNDKVQILNPPKDNLICDAAKVEEILGVPPERVIDVMALRGDAIDNIPGAPGIGDKGSVEIIKRFGTVEQALERAAEVEKKTYRESLQNNREAILFSKSMATIDTNVPIELDVESMRAGEPNSDDLRALFTELEFTSLLKELLPVVEVSETHYTEAKSAVDVEHVISAVAAEGALAVAVEQEEAACRARRKRKKKTSRRTRKCRSWGAWEELAVQTAPEPAARRAAISAAAGSATHRQARFRRRCRTTALRADQRCRAQSDARLQGGDSRARSAGDLAGRRATRSDAVFVLARSDLVIAPAGGRRFAAVQSEAGRRPCRSCRHYWTDRGYVAP